MSSKSDRFRSVFETTIRYLGGLLSAYELSGQKYPILVEKAKQVADKMSLAWSLGNTVPYGFVNFNTSQPTLATVSSNFHLSSMIY